MSTAHKRSCKPYLFFTIYIYIYLCQKHPHCLIIFSNIECNREPIRSTVSLLTLGNCWLKPTPNCRGSQPQDLSVQGPFEGCSTKDRACGDGWKWLQNFFFSVQPFKHEEYWIHSAIYSFPKLSLWVMAILYSTLFQDANEKWRLKEIPFPPQKKSEVILVLVFPCCWNWEQFIQASE